MDGTAKPPPAGWYADPDDGALQRFWDGSRWTSSRMPRTDAVPLEGTDPAPAEPSRYASDEPRPPAGNLPAAAWYADPENPSGMRYWDGERWTEHRTDYLAAPPQPKPSEGMVAAGYILSFVFPIAGIVIGAILIRRGDRNGRWIVALSVLFIAAFLVIGSAGESGSS